MKEREEEREMEEDNMREIENSFRNMRERISLI